MTGIEQQTVTVVPFNIEHRKFLSACDSFNGVCKLHVSNVPFNLTQ